MTQGLLLPYAKLADRAFLRGSSRAVTCRAAGEDVLEMQRFK